MPDHSIVSESQIALVVTRFYTRVRADEMLGDVFEMAVRDWPSHLHRLTDFWSSVMLTSGRYKGQPVPAHQALADRIDPAMFDRWLALWTEVTDEMLPPDAAGAMQAKAARIAESLQLALFYRLSPRKAASDSQHSISAIAAA